MPRRATALVFLLLFLTTAGAAQKEKKPTLLPSIAPLDLPQALDLYADGRFDQAVRMVAQAGDEVGRHLRPHWAVTARQWIDADPARAAATNPRGGVARARDRADSPGARRLARRRKAIPRARPRACSTGRRFSCSARRARSRPSARGISPPRRLPAACATGATCERAVDPPRVAPLLPGLMDRALARFPDDAPLRLERALAAAGRFNLVVDGARRCRRAGDALVPWPRPVPVPANAHGRDERSRQHARRRSSTILLVGAEARMRLGYLHWTAGRDDEARQELITAAEQARDADVRFLAHFLLGWIAAARRRRRRRDCAARGGARGAAGIAVRGGGACGRRAPARQRRQGARDRAGDTRPAPRRCRSLAALSLRPPPAMARAPGRSCAGR